MDWGVIQTGVRAAVYTALGLPDVSGYQPTVWDDTPEAGTAGGWPDALGNPTPRVFLTYHTGATVGQDELNHTYDAEEDALYPVVQGPRMFWVSVKIEIDNQTPGASAMQWASRLRTRLRLPRVQRLMDAAGFAVALVRETKEASYPSDGRRVSVAVTDLVCNAAENDTDRDDTGGYFNRVRMSGKAGTDMEDVAEREIGPPPEE